MKAIRFLIHFIALLVILFTGSCKKDKLNKTENSFVAIVETETNYITRSCFQLADGTYIIVGNGDIHPVMARFSESGDFIWQKKLPRTLFNLIKGIPLPSGGFVLAGTDSTSGKQNENGITNIGVYTNAGDSLNFTSIISIPSVAGLHNQLDFIHLENGNLAFCLTPDYNGYSHSRLLILDQSLVTLFDKVYYDSTGIPFKGLSLPHIQEGKDGSIYFCYSVYKPFINNGTQVTGLMKLNAGDYSFNFFKDSIGLGYAEIPGSFAIDKNGNVCVASAKQNNSNSLPFIHYHAQDSPNSVENYSIGRSVSVLRTDTSGKAKDRHDYSGFPQLASLMKIIRTSDGGFMLAGTSNQNENLSLVSTTQVILIKTDANLNQQWMKQFNTTYPSVAMDVFETRDGGFAVGGFAKSFNKYFKMMIIKTDANGN